MSGVITRPLQDMYRHTSAKGVVIDWGQAHPWAANYLDLWTSPVDGQFGPVAKEVLAQSSQTKLMVFELAQAPYVEKELQAS